MAISARRALFLLVLALALLAAAALAGSAQHQRALQVSAHSAPVR